MSTPREDQLYRIFEARLLSGEFDELPPEALLTDVVDRYCQSINANQTVPLHLQKNVRNDLLEDVRDMLRLKIYGYAGVGEFNRKRKGL